MLTWEQGHHLLDESYNELAYILDKNPDTFIFIEDNEVIGTALLYFENDGIEIYIANIDSAFTERKGYGRKMV